MVAQVYAKQRINYFNAFIPNEPPYSYDFYLGSFQTWEAIKNTSNEFISLGGDPSTPLIYKYQDTGITDFTINIMAPPSPIQSEIFSSRAYFELWINGIKPYYSWFEERQSNIFDRTISVYGEKNKTTKFKFRLTVLFMVPTPDLKKYYFEGDPDTVYSSITAKFIPDITAENKEPILITEDTKLSLNRRHIVKAASLKTLQLTIDENCKIGDWIEIKNMDLGNFQINSGDNIDILMNGLITRVKNGYIRSKKRGDFIRLECMEITPRIVFSDTNTIGTFTII
jgi:hypothetical protein